MTFAKRARVTTGATGRFKHWPSSDSRYEIIEVLSQYTGHRFIVARAGMAGAFPVSYHRTKSAAIRKANQLWHHS